MFSFPTSMWSSFVEHTFESNTTIWWWLFSFSKWRWKTFTKIIEIEVNFNSSSPQPLQTTNCTQLYQPADLAYYTSLAPWAVHDTCIDLIIEPGSLPDSHHLKANLKRRKRTHHVNVELILDFLIFGDNHGRGEGSLAKSARGVGWIKSSSIIWEDTYNGVWLKSLEEAHERNGVLLQMDQSHVYQYAHMCCMSMWSARALNFQ